MGGWVYPLKGVVLSPQGGGFSPQGGGLIPQSGHWGGGVINPLGWFYPPFSVILSPHWVGRGRLWRRGMARLYVNLEPQYRKTSCLRSERCAVKRIPLGMGAGACPISISGMEVGEVMEGQGTTYGFTLSVLLHIALCICVIGGALSAVRAQCKHSATIWASSRIGDPYFVILGTSLLPLA